MKYSLEKAERMALKRVRDSLERAEAELSHLAAPDGTVAIQIDDLRAVLSQMNGMRDTLALGQRRWTENWYGSEPGKGSSIWTLTEHGAQGEMLAHIGGDEKTHEAVRQIVMAHNAALNVNA